MREPLVTLFITIRLLWGRLLHPLLFSLNSYKYYPTPRRTVYKKHLCDFFFLN
ncbi:MAG: hypothetical protein Kow0042_18950 [Calditrichia bacterium]